LYFLSRKDDVLTFYNPLRPGFPVLDTRPIVRQGASAVESVKAELVQDLRLGSDELAVSTLRVLWPSPEAIDAAGDVAKDADRNPDVRAQAIAFLLTARDPQSLNQAIEFIQEVRHRPRGPYWVQLVAGHMLDYGFTARDVDRLDALREPAVDHAVGAFLLTRRVAVDAAHYVPIAADILERTTDFGAQWAAYEFLSGFRPESEDRSIHGFMKNRLRDVEAAKRWWETEGKLKYGSRRKDGTAE
jgi:hypothetical protein